MKKQIPLLLFLLMVHLSSWTQPKSNANTNCTDSMAFNSKGRWIKYPDLLTSFTKTQQQEALNRLKAIHEILLELYPKPTGVDIRWNNTVGVCYFGSKRRYYYNSDSLLSSESINILPNAYYYYRTTFPPYFCAQTEKGVILMPGEKNESSVGITVTANNLEGLVGGNSVDDDWMIDGFPIKMRSPMSTAKWKGYVVHYPESGSNIRSILIHREGELPYKPVTRKQYLDRCIIYQTKLYDQLIKQFEQMPVRSLAEQEAEKKNKLAKFEKDFGNDPKRLKATVDYYLSGYQTEQQARDERIHKVKETKMSELKRFSDELEKTTNEGLLDSPAVVLLKYYSSPIFETDPQKGSMLVIENRDYIRKELPIYVPQFFFISWKWSDYVRHKEYEQIFDQDFPLKKLQEMIDK